MKVVLFGATGMIGQGVLRECLVADDVDAVVSVVRRPSGVTHEKLHEVVHEDFSDFSSIPELVGADACFYCLGISSVGMSEAEYTRVTYDYALAAARALLVASPGLCLVFVSGAGTDSSEKGRTMWARVKGRTENALLALPFRSAAMFRPGFIRPMHGVVSRTWSYRIMYALLAPLGWLLPRVAPGIATTGEIVARAMLRVARQGAPKAVMESSDINAFA